MKHLKLFESGLEYDNQKLSNEEYEKYFYEPKSESLDDFSTNEREQIRNFFASKSIPLHKWTSDRFPYVGNETYISVNHFYKQLIWALIHKLKDEWFLLNFHTIKGNIYYKCDQLEGLLELLEDLLNWIPTTDPKRLIDKEDNKKKLDQLRKEVFKKIRILSYDELNRLNQSL
jgi:hypothetical protein